MRPEGSLIYLSTKRGKIHFAYEEERVVGMTLEGRTTVSLLQLNRDERLSERRSGVG